jgi:hypothetical protein
MAADSSQRVARLLRAAVVVVVGAAAAVVLADRICLGRLTPERARDALADLYPELRDAPVAYQGGRVLVGDFSCDRGSRTWGRSFACPRAGMVCPEGRFERSWFGQWRAVETRRWTIACVLTNPPPPADPAAPH